VLILVRQTQTPSSRFCETMAFFVVARARKVQPARTAPESA
jgi:hypothetical protein